jgi:hypothetical protein
MNQSRWVTLPEEVGLQIGFLEEIVYLSDEEFQKLLEPLRTESLMPQLRQEVYAAEQAIRDSGQSNLRYTHYHDKVNSIRSIEAETDPERRKYNEDRLARLHEQVAKLRNEAESKVPARLHQVLADAKKALAVAEKVTNELDRLDEEMGINRRQILRTEEKRRKEVQKRQEAEIRRRKEEQKRLEEEQMRLEDEQKRRAAEERKREYAERCRLALGEDGDHIDDDDEVIREAHINHYKNNHCWECDPNEYWDDYVQPGGGCDGYCLDGSDMIIVSNQWDCNDVRFGEKKFRSCNHEVYARVVYTAAFDYDDDPDAIMFLDRDCCPCERERIA